jgi:protein-disulfide isomerase
MPRQKKEKMVKSAPVQKAKRGRLSEVSKQSSFVKTEEKGYSMPQTVQNKQNDSGVTSPWKTLDRIVDAGLSNFATGLLLLAAFLLGYLVAEVRGGGITSQKTAPQAVQQQAKGNDPDSVPLDKSQWKQVTGNAKNQVGKDNAKVTMVEYSDFQCPFCERHYTQTYKALYEKYVKEGKMRIIFRDLPLEFHSFAKTAALAARCGGEQGKYAEMHDKLFDTQSEWAAVGPDNKLVKTEAEVVEMYKGYAAGVGVNASKFNSCMDEKKFAKDIDEDLKMASELGASATPTFFVEGDRIVGAQPLSVFEAKIEEKLK